MLSVLMYSCEKGDTGPAGPAGPAGPSGPAGTPGADGADGSSAIKTDTFSVYTTDWKYNSIYWVGTSPNVSQGQVSKYFDHNAPLITDSILQLGAILVYYTNPSALQGQWTPLPISWLDNFTGNYTFNYAYVASLNKLQMHFYFAKVAGNVPPAIATFAVPTIRVKLVTISGELGLTDEAIKEIRKMPYDEAQKLLHFSDF